LRGTEHVFMAHIAGGDSGAKLEDLSRFALDLGDRVGSRIRVTAVTTAGNLSDPPGIALFQDRDGYFAGYYGDRDGSFLVRPDGYVGWRGRTWRDPGFLTHLDSVFQPTGAFAPGLSASLPLAHE
jgi:hypothetical protein